MVVTDNLLLSVLVEFEAKLFEWDGGLLWGRSGVGLGIHVVGDFLIDELG